MLSTEDKGSKERYVIAWLPGLVFFLFQVAFNLVFFLWGLPYVSHLTLQGLQNHVCTYNKTTMRNECVGDNSFLILLFSILSLVLLVWFILVYFRSLKAVGENERMAQEGKPLPRAKDDLLALLDGKFYKTILALPVLGVVIFTIVPIIFMVSKESAEANGGYLASEQGQLTEMADLCSLLSQVNEQKGMASSASSIGSRCGCRFRGLSGPPKKASFTSKRRRNQPETSGPINASSITRGTRPQP